MSDRNRHIPDLDWSDVERDAARMQEEAWHATYGDWYDWPEADLLHQRYLSGIFARRGEPEAIDEVQFINYLLYPDPPTPIYF